MKLENTFVDVDIVRDSVTTCHFFKIRFELAHILAHDFGLDNISLWGHVYFWDGWEGHSKIG